MVRCYTGVRQGAKVIEQKGGNYLIWYRKHQVGMHPFPVVVARRIFRDHYLGVLQQESENGSESHSNRRSQGRMVPVVGDVGIGTTSQEGLDFRGIVFNASTHQRCISKAIFGFQVHILSGKQQMNDLPTSGLAGNVERCVSISIANIDIHRFFLQ